MNPSTQKRKAINDFFTPIPKRTATQSPSIPHIYSQDIKDHDSTVNHTILTTPVPGLTLHPNFITPPEERAILDFLNDSTKCTWRTDLSRRTMHFGGTYCLMPSKPSRTTPSPSSSASRQILQAPPIPPELNFLLQRLHSLSIYPPHQTPQYCIVNEYTSNTGISAHTENFQFGEPVVGLSLLSPCPIRFHELKRPCDGSVRSGKAGKAEKTGRREDVWLPGRSLLVMRGESRWGWQHEIVRGGRGRGVGWKRVSLTFRFKGTGERGRSSGNDVLWP